MTKIYRHTTLEPIMKSFNVNLLNEYNWTFQQINALAHKAKTAQWWLKKNDPNFIDAKD